MKKILFVFTLAAFSELNSGREAKFHQFFLHGNTCSSTVFTWLSHHLVRLCISLEQAVLSPARSTAPSTEQHSAHSCHILPMTTQNSPSALRQVIASVSTIEN